MNIGYTINNNLCTGCGICEGVCNKHAISIVTCSGTFRPQIDSTKCNDCGLCLRACAGAEMNLKEYSDSLFCDAGIKYDQYIGKYHQCYTGYSNDNDLRYHAASGGLTTQFLIWLLENDKIDGAVVTRFKKDAPYMVNTFVAKSKEELIESRSSKYAPVTHAKMLRLIKEAPGSRYVVVGVPCQIQSWRKAMKIDKDLCTKIIGLFGLYCSSSRTFNFTEYILKERNIDMKKLSYLSYRDNGCLGGLVAKGEDFSFYQDYQLYCHPLRSIFVPRRCLLCVDHYSELADVSFGDIHIEPYLDDKVGVNSVIVRNKYWKDLLEEVMKKGVITLDEINVEILNASQKSAKMKKDRNMRFVALNKALGYNIPQYGEIDKKGVDLKTIVQYVHNRIQQFIGSKRIFWFLIPLLKKKTKVV